MTTYVSTALLCSNGTILNAPSGDGTSRQLLATNGAGQLNFISLSVNDLSDYPTFGAAAYKNLSWFCQTVNNLSDVNAATAKTNLGLATVASTGVYSDLTGKPDLTVYATLASPALTGNPTAPTQTAGDSSTNIATTSFVSSAINTVLAAAPNKNSVKYATTAALPANTYANGTSGVGATLTANANGTVTVDSSALLLNDELLVRNEVTAANNGIYKVTQAGDSTHPLILTRRTDFDQTSEVFAGDAVYVTSGSNLASTTWQMNTVGSITIGSSAINWTQSAGPGSYLAGTGMTLTGTTFSVNASQTQITAVGTIGTGIWQGTAISSTYVSTGTSGANIPLLNGANTHSGSATFSANGAASTPAINVTGVPFAGTTSNSVPLLYFNNPNATSQPSPLNTAGCIFGANNHGTTDFINYFLDGFSEFSVGYTGIVTSNAFLSKGDVRAGGAANTFYWTNSTQLWALANGQLKISNFANSQYFQLSCPSTNVMQLGALDASSPVAQTLSVQNVVAGTSNTNGANLTFAASKGTGTGTGGSFVFQVAPASTTGSTPNTLVTALTIDSTSLATFAGNVNGISFAINSSPVASQASFYSQYAPYAAGTATTNFPLFFGSSTGATAVTSWSTGGTYYGANCVSGFAGNFIDFHVNGGGSIFSVGSNGAVGCFGIANGSANSYAWNSRSKISSPADGQVLLGNNAGTGFTYLQLGPTVAAPAAVAINAGSVVVGTSNTNGINFTFNGSQGTGTGAGGSLIFATAPAGSTGTAQNALVTAVTIDATQSVAIAGNVSAANLSGKNTGDQIITANRLKNSSFRFAQRLGASPGTYTTLVNLSNSSYDAYGADRWKCAFQTANVQYKQVDTNGALETGMSTRYYGAWKQITAAGKFCICQPIESLECPGRDGATANYAVFSIWLKASAAKTIRLGVLQLNSSGTTDAIPVQIVPTTWGSNATDPAWGSNLSAITPTNLANTVVSGSGASCSVTTSWQQFSICVSLPTTFKNLVPIVWTDSQFSASDVLFTGQSDFYQTSVAPAATRSYDEPDVSTDWLKCRRYYKSLFGANSAGVTLNSSYAYYSSTSAGSYMTTFLFDVPMRSAPASSTNIATGTYGTSGTASTWGFQVSNINWVTLSGAVAVLVVAKDVVADLIITLASGNTLSNQANSLVAQTGMYLNLDAEM